MKSFFRNKNNIIIGLCAVVILMGIGFAAFSQRLQIGDTTVTNSDWNVYIKSAVAGTPVGGATGSAQVVDRASAKLTASLSSPGDSVTYTITVANDGNIDAILDLITLSASNDDSVIKYSYSGIVEDEELLAESEKSFTVKIEYDSNKTGTVTDAQKQNTLTLDLDFVQKTEDTVVTPSETAASMLASKAVTSGDGLYADTYENGRYVYKGASPSNYITFNGENAGWRILAVEADGSLKIIRNSSIGNYAYDAVTTCNGVAYNSKKKNTTYKNGTYEIENKIYMTDSALGNDFGCNAWTRPTTLNTYLNNTYKGTIDTTYLQTHDFPVGSVTYNNQDLAAQITTEKSSVWNGDIGLMSVSDYLRANTNTEQCGNYSLNSTNKSICKTTNYLFTAIGSKLPWTINSYSGSTTLVFTIDGSGGVYHYYSYQEDYGVVPVLYLKPDITLRGSGTDIDPYEIVPY